MSKNAINRRDLFKVATATASIPLLSKYALADTNAKPAKASSELGAPKFYEYQKPSKPITAIIIGAGQRGNLYANYAHKQPDQWKIVGVAEPIPERNERMAECWGIPEENRFTTWEHVFERPKFADVCVITTPDSLHYGPAMAAIEKGYDLLLEKAIAPRWSECSDILNLAKKKGSIVAVCHVLRYAPYFRQLKHVVESGQIGEVVSVQHMEPIEHIHMSHSFVRGNWGNEAKSNPILLSKSCHDLDILRWVIDKPCKKVSSFGGLKLFTPENKPAGAPKRCTDGCPVEKTCPFSAIRIYGREKLWGTGHFVIPDQKPETIINALKTNEYGRCVFQCDNDVLDHQVVNMEFEGGTTAAFSLEGLTSYGGRKTRIMGTKGDIVGENGGLSVFKFSPRKRIEWNVRDYDFDLSGHGGGDTALVRDLVQAVSRRDPSLLTSNLQASMESHLIGFKAEESRKTGNTVKVDIKKIMSAN
jgi:predicted dehydrogenase